MKNKGKKLKVDLNIKKIKFSASSSKSTNTQHPIYSLTHMVNEYSLHHCEQEEKASFADTLHKLGKVTWAQICTSPRHGIGTEVIGRESIKATIPENITRDTNILAFRFCGKAPMVGYREDRIFHIIWLDRNCTLYDH